MSRDSQKTWDTFDLPATIGMLSAHLEFLRAAAVDVVRYIGETKDDHLEQVVSKLQREIDETKYIETRPAWKSRLQSEVEFIVKEHLS